MNGLIPLPSARPGQVLAVDGGGDILLFVSPQFVPSFQLIKRRYGDLNGRALILAERLEPAAGHALLEFARGGGRLDPVAAEPGAPGWRQRLQRELRHSYLKTYRFELHERSLLAQLNTTLLADMRTADHAAALGSHDTAEGLRLAITAELSRQLAQRIARQQAWDGVFREEPWYQQSLILVGAALTGLQDVAKGLADIAVLAVDLAGDAARVTFTLSQQLLQGRLDQVEALVRQLGGRLQGGIEGAKRLLREAERALRLLFADRAMAGLLVDYLASWAAATPITERVRATFRIGGEVLLALGLAMASGGAGAAAMAGSAARQIGAFSERLLYLLAQAARLLQQRTAAAEILVDAVLVPRARGVFPSEIEHAVGRKGAGASSAAAHPTEKFLVNGASSKAPLTRAQIDEILETPKGQRPDPATYLSPAYRAKHAALFEDGAVRIQPSAPTGKIGRAETWVLPKSIADKAVASSGGDIRKLERLLGFDEGYLGDSPVRVDIPSITGYRIPTGNEFGANGFWRPGGYTWPGELPEAIIDPVSPGGYSVSSIL